ncbi:MAG TPA: DUF4864 domain-containing protein [Methylomirabilota bacterium]|jgi:hypothetical protein
MKRIALGLALVLLPLCAAWAQAEKSSAKAAAEPVVRQLEAFRRDDYDTAYTFASEEIQAQFDRQSFEAMVRRGYPEIARSIVADVIGMELQPGGRAYVTVRIRGANGQTIEALYELVWQDAWKIDGVATRPATGII